MPNRVSPSLLGAALAAALLLAPAPSQAQLDACGDIYVEADAMCEILVEGGCTAMCEPLSFQASCAADLYVECDGMCTATVDASCMASCDIGACEARCTADPGSFDCRAECTLTAEARCDAQCAGMASGSEAHGQCIASCEATFAAECEASCEVTPPSAECMARCEASCEGSCTAEANVDCQVECQSGGYAECTAELMGGCTAQCTEPDGALFCDGQYVDHGGNLDACIEALRSALNIEVDASARGSSMCTGGMCSAEGEAEASASCAVAWTRPAGAGLAWLAALVPLCLLFRRRRR